MAVEATKEEFLKLAEGELNSPNNDAASKCFNSLVLIVPDAEKNSVATDQTTGIEIVNIKKGAVRFPTHPTPAS